MPAHSGAGARRNWSGRRARALLSLALLLMAGLVAHVLALGFLGDVLYAAFAAVGLVFLLPRQPPWRVAAIAYGYCAVIEAFQATGVPDRIGGSFPPARLVLGTGFAWGDLVAYAVGVLVVLAVDLRTPLLAP